MKVSICLCALVGILSFVSMPESCAQDIRVMQWNVLKGLGTRTVNTNDQAKAISRIVNFEQPDILLLNEIQSANVTNNEAGLIDWVTNNLPYLGDQPGVSFFVKVSELTDGLNRNAAISRYPILAETTYDDGMRGLHSLSCQLAAGNIVQVYHAHFKAGDLSSDAATRQANAQFAADTIHAWAATNSIPYIFGGDWNEDEENPQKTITDSYHPITTVRQDGGLMEFKPVSLDGNPKTLNTSEPAPTRRFDYLLAATNRLAATAGIVFSTPVWAQQGLYTNLSPKHLATDSQTASDHYPVFVDYYFPTPEPDFDLTPTGSWQTTGFEAGPFNPTSATYTLSNTNGTPLTWRITTKADWLTLSATNGILPAFTSTNITVLLNTNANSLVPDVHLGRVVFQDITTGKLTARDAQLTALPLPRLAVSPTNGWSSSGTTGGPFSPVTNAYTVTNLGSNMLTWTASNGAPWISLSNLGGQLAPGAGTNVIVQINANATNLAAGGYADTVYFTNITNGKGNTCRSVNLTINPVGILSVIPSSDSIFIGPPAGPFSPSSCVYTLTNMGDAALSWAVDKSAGWLNTSATNGSLAVGGSTNVTFSLDASAATLSAGSYADLVGFINVSNGRGTTSRAIGLSVGLSPPTLDALPPVTAGTSNTVAWGAVMAADEYEVQCSIQSNFTDAVSSGWIAGTQYTFTNLKNLVQYFYRVRARGHLPGVLASWSQTSRVEFDMDARTNVNTLTSPGDVLLSKAARIWTENFDEQGTAWSGTIFTNTNQSGGASFGRDTLNAENGAPSANPPLPVNAGGDLEATYYKSSPALAGASAALMANLPLAAVTIDGYLAINGTSRVGFALRSGANGRTNYVAQIWPNSTTNASLMLTQPNGISFIIFKISPSFALHQSDENFHLVFSVSSNVLSAALWRVSAIEGAIVETPIDFGSGNNTIVVTNSTLATGQVGLYGFMSGSSPVFYDDVTITENAGAGQYKATGTIVSMPISAGASSPWSTLAFTADTNESGSGLTMDVLDTAGTLLAANIASGTDLSLIPAVSNVSAVRLRANLSTSNPASTPKLSDWSISYWLTTAGTMESDWSAVTSSVQDATGDLIAWSGLFFETVDAPGAGLNDDPDADGMNNLYEFLADTDPTNSASVFHITEIAREGDGMRITWQIGSGKTNDLQSAEGLGGGYSDNFTNSFTITNTVGTFTTHLDPGAATNSPSRYYRVRLDL